MNRHDFKIATFMTMAYQLASLSTCPRRQVGCILLDEGLRIVGSGYNGVPSNVPHCTNDGDEPCNCVHAEENALANCALNNGLAVVKYAIVTTLPCKKCLTELVCRVEEANGKLEAVYGCEVAQSSAVHSVCHQIQPADPVFRKWKAQKVGGNYQAEGTIVGEYDTLAGLKRLVFEFNTPRGMQHIFTPKQVIGERTKRLVPCYGTYTKLSTAEVIKNGCEACALHDNCRRKSYE